MGLKDKKFLSLKEIEGAVSSHDGFIKGELRRKKEAMEYVDDVSKLAEYIGGEVTSVGAGEDWAIKKEVFPGIEIIFLYDHADEEFDSNLRVLYSGERVGRIRGEDLVALTIACANHMLRYVKETNPEKELPATCYKV